MARQIRESERPQNGTDIEMESTEQNRSSLGNWFGPCSKSGQSAQRSTEGGRKKSRAPRCKAVKRLGPIKNIGCWIPPHKLLLLAVPEPVGVHDFLRPPSVPLVYKRLSFIRPLLHETNQPCDFALSSTYNLRLKAGHSIPGVGLVSSRRICGSMYI